jgi:hypothetical protein
MPVVYRNVKCLFADEDRFRGISMIIIMKERCADLLAIATDGKVRFDRRRFVLFVWMSASSTARASNSNFLWDYDRAGKPQLSIVIQKPLKVLTHLPCNVRRENGRT